MSKQANVVLSLDFGTKKIGVCIAETYTGQSSPLPVLKNDEHLSKDGYDSLGIRFARKAILMINSL